MWRFFIYIIHINTNGEIQKFSFLPYRELIYALKEIKIGLRCVHNKRKNNKTCFFTVREYQLSHKFLYQLDFFKNNYVKVPLIEVGFLNSPK